MLGKEVKYSGLQRDRVTRLFHREHARYPNKRVHADLLVDGPTFDLRHKMLHFYIRSFDRRFDNVLISHSGSKVLPVSKATFLPKPMTTKQVFLAAMICVLCKLE